MNRRQMMQRLQQVQVVDERIAGAQEHLVQLRLGARLALGVARQPQRQVQPRVGLQGTGETLLLGRGQQSALPSPALRVQLGQLQALRAQGQRAFELRRLRRAVQA